MIVKRSRNDYGGVVVKREVRHNRNSNGRASGGSVVARTWQNYTPVTINIKFCHAVPSVVITVGGGGRG